MMGPSEYEVTKGGIIFYLWVAAFAAWFTIYSIQMAMTVSKVLYVFVPAFAAIIIYGVVQSIKCLVAVIKDGRASRRMREQNKED